MIYGKLVKEKEELDIVNNITRKVFAEELGLVMSEDDGDGFVLSALVFDGTEPVCAGHLVTDGSSVSITEVSVLPEYRGKKYGDFIVRFLADTALESNAQEVCLDALAGTEGFFRTIGFEAAGEEIEKNGGTWQPMILYADRFRSCFACQKDH